MQRRGFLAAVLAGAAAPAVVKASSLMKLAATDSGVLIYKATGRYDLNLDNMEQMMRNASEVINLQPTQLLVPSAMMAQCLQILNSEFDKEYAKWTRT